MNKNREMENVMQQKEIMVTQMDLQIKDRDD